MQTSAAFTNYNTASSACISDKNGKFLFAVDSGFIRNSNFQIMANSLGILNKQVGLSFHFINSSNIIKKPGNNEEYYIFHQDSCSKNVFPGSNAIRNVYYSIVDMSLNGGLGAVTIKNRILFQSNAFKVDATYHSNDKDIWMVFQKTGRYVGSGVQRSNRIVAFLVTSAGIQSTIHSSLNNFIDESPGEIKVSPKGDVIAISEGYEYQGFVSGRYQSQHYFLLARFDNKTGKCYSDLKIESRPLRYFQNNGRIGGGNLCLSPDGKMLYYGVFDATQPQTRKSLNTHHLTQLDISVYHKDSIEAKKHQFKSPDSSRIWRYNGNIHYGKIGASDIQLGLDGKIYWKTSEKSIGRINRPNIARAGSNFTDSVFVFPHDTFHFFESFPNFFSGYFKFSNIHVENKCFSDSTRFSLLDTGSVANVIWDFGDASPLKSANPTDTVKHSYQRTGVFTAKGYLTHYRGTRDTVTEVITIDTIQIPVLSDSTYTLCNGDTLSLWNTRAAKHFFWNDSTFNNTLQVRNSGTYWYTSYNHCGEWYDSLVVDSAVVPKVNLGRDTVFCADSLRLNAFLEKLNLLVARSIERLHFYSFKNGFV